MDKTYMIDVCRQAIYDIAKANKNVVVMGADFREFAELFANDIPNQYIDVGIAEQNLVGSAAGMSDNGVIPIVYAVSPFLAYRAYEFIRNDICMQKKNVKIIGHSMGMDFCTWGSSHHTTEDIAALRALPNLTVFCPATALETEQMVKEMMNIDGPVYIRLGRERKREILREDYKFEVSRGVVVKEGKDITLISTGTISYDVVKASEVLENEGISVRVVHLPTIKPLDEQIIIESARLTGKIISVDEHNVIGGIGTAIADVLATNKVSVDFKKMGLNDCFSKGYGRHDDMKEMNGISIQDIVQSAMKLMG